MVKQYSSRSIVFSLALTISVHVCVFILVIQVRAFLGSEDILAGDDNV